MPFAETDEGIRSRLIWTLFAGNAVLSTAYIGVMTVSTLISKQITGSTGLSGTPGMMAMLGVGIGATAFSSMSVKVGRRPTFSGAYSTAALGAILAGLSLALGSLALLLIGMFFIGFGRSAGTLARFAAGDLRHAERRAGAISLVLWASAIGAIVGPLLIGPSGASAEAVGLDPLMGPILASGSGFVLASLLMFVGLRPEPLRLSIDDYQDGRPRRRSPMSQVVKIPSVRLSLVALMANQFVMALLMVMTPLHIRINNGDLTTIGWVMMALALGMFAVAPITGRLVDQFGPKRFIALGIAISITASLLAATAVTAKTSTLLVSLFLLGVGWNFGFVAGSTLLQEGVPIFNRVRVQGLAVTISLISGATAAALSGVVVAASSYSALAVFGAVVALLPLVALLQNKRL